MRSGPLTALADAAARRPRLAVLALAAAVGLAFQGSRGLYESTEGRYAESALEMLQRGEYLEPTLAGRPHLTKPPLAYWAIAAGIAALGPNEWGARLAGAVAFCLGALAVAATGAALWDRRTGLLAGLVFASSPFAAGGAAALSIDPLVAFVEAAAMLLYVRALRAPDAASERRWVRGMWIVWGIAFLTKGPPALLPLLAVAAFQALSPRRVRLADPVGLALFAITAAWWYALVALRHPGLLAYFLRDEVIGRVATNEFGRNPQWWKPFVMYLPLLVLGQGAWVGEGVRLLRAERLLAPRALLARMRRGDGGSLLLLWLLLPLAVFFVSSSRLPLYVLPLCAPIALALGRALARRGEGALPRAVATAALSAAAIVALKAAAAYAAPPSRSDMKPLHAAVRSAGGPDAVVRAYREAKLFGLQFYLGGALRRVSQDGHEPWADERLEAAVAAIRSTPDRPHVVVAARGAAPELGAALDRAGLSHRTVPCVGRSLLVVAPAAGALSGR